MKERRRKREREREREEYLSDEVKRETHKSTPVFLTRVLLHHGWSPPHFPSSAKCLWISNNIKRRKTSKNSSNGRNELSGEKCESRTSRRKAFLSLSLSLALFIEHILSLTLSPHHLFLHSIVSCFLSIMATQQQIFQFKLVLLGESSVGKSSLVLRFVKGQFLDFQDSTIGAAFLTQTVCLNETTVKFEIWDTAGQERYHSLAPMYYRGAQAAIVVYDITNQDSFVRAKNWVKELQRQGNPDIVIALAGNKVDLEEERKISLEVRRSRLLLRFVLFLDWFLLLMSFLFTPSSS